MSSRPPADGWFLEVDISDEDTRRLRPAGEPEWSPVVNDLPSIDIPVRPADDIWTSGAADEAEVRIYKDGVELPFEQISGVNRRRGDSRSEVVLTCIGGTDLDKRVQRVYQNKAATTAVENLITNETDLTPNVDQPGSGSDVQFLSVSGSSELNSGLSLALEGSAVGDSDVPLTLNSSLDRIERAQTAWLWTAEQDFSTNDGAEKVTDAGAEQDTAVKLTPQGDDPDLPFGATFDISDQSAAYDVPSGSLTIGIHARRESSFGSSDIDIVLAGGQAALPTTTLDTDYEWYLFEDTAADIAFGIVQGGQISYDADEREPEVYISGAVAFDSRAPPDTIDDSPDPYFEGPGPYDGTGPATRLETDEQVSSETLEGATTTVSLATGSAGDTLATTARTSAGENTETGATTATVEPGATSGQASGAVALSGSGSQSGQSPETRTTPQYLDSLSLTGLSTDGRQLIGKAYDDDLVNILQDIGEQTGSVWAVEPGPNGPTLEWTRPGARDPQGTIRASAVDLDRISQRVEAATVRGGRRQRVEEFTAPDPSTSYTVTLNHDSIIPGTERVVRTSDDTEMEPVTDYELDYLDGVFEPLAGGSINDNDSLRIEYQQTPTGRYESGQFDGDAVADRVFDIGSVTTPDDANQAAKRIVQETPAARIEARVDLSGLGPTTSVVRALGVDALDIDRPFSVQGFDDSPGRSVLRLGTARPVDEIVARIASDVGDVDQRV